MKVIGVREATDHVYYSMTKSLCGVFKTAVDAKIVNRNVAVTEGCPFDCGACPQHQQKVYLPVIPITSGCNLDCPICYTINKNDHAFAMSKENFQRILDHLVEDHAELDIINFTGGEPTLHPELPEFLEMCRAAGGFVPFARLMPRAKLFELLADSLYIEPREKLEEVFREIIDSLWASPEKIAEDMEKSVGKGGGILYTPWFWRYILLIIRHIPDFIFKKMSL